MYRYPSTYILACLCFDTIVALHFLEIALYPNTLFRFVSYTRRCAVRVFSRLAEHTDAGMLVQVLLKRLAG
jgi:hypothetical protein